LQKELDITLIQMTLKGDNSAFAVLVDRYQAYVFTIVLRYVPERELAEELAQDVFVKAYRNLGGFRGDSKFTTWLYAIVNTTCLSQVRKRKDGTVLPGDEAMSRIAGIDAANTAPSSRLEGQTRKQLLENAIRQLPEGEGQVITLHYILEQSIDEVCQITGLTEANVKVKLFRARQKLKTIMSTKQFEDLRR